MSLRIALVTGEYPPMQGGVGAFTQVLGQSMAAAGHEIHVITSREARPPRKAPPADQASLGGTLRRLYDINEPVPIEFGLLHPRGRRWRWAETRMIADLVTRYDFDIVNIQYQPAAYNMRSAAVNFFPWRLKEMTKTVVTFHDLRVPYLFPKAGQLRERAVRFMASQADGVIATNRADFEKLIAWGARRVVEIPIGSNIIVHQPNHIELQEACEDLELPEKYTLLAYFGFVNESKGVDVIIEALSKMPKSVHLVCIGGRLGTSDSVNNQLFLDHLNRLIEVYKLQSRVHWTGYLSDRRVSSYFNLADLVVLPYRDGVSLRRGTLMAAMAHGRPIVSTLPPEPIAELKHGENIFLVPPNDPEAIVDAVKQYLQDDQPFGKIGRAAQETSYQFSWDTIADQTLNFFEALLAT